MQVRHVLPLPDFKDRSTLREWWHDILRKHGPYPCYAIFLLLPSDKEAINYVFSKEPFRSEIHLMSGSDCLVIVLSKTMFALSDFISYNGPLRLTVLHDTEIKEHAGHGALRRPDPPDLTVLHDTEIKEHVHEGHCITVARLFDISFDKFPCLVVFDDIRSPNHILVSLSGMTTEEISEKMRVLFSIIRKSVSEGKNPLTAIESQRNQESLLKAGQTIVSQLRNITQQSFETAMEAWIKASIK